LANGIEDHLELRVIFALQSVELAAQILVRRQYGTDYTTCHETCV
jgi:hypothetical protein